MFIYILVKTKSHLFPVCVFGILRNPPNVANNRKKTSLGQPLRTPRSLAMTPSNIISVIPNTAHLIGKFGLSPTIQRFSFEAQGGRRYSAAVWIEDGGHGYIGTHPGVDSQRKQYGMRAGREHLYYTFDQEGDQTRYIYCSTEVVRSEWRICIAEANTSIPSWLERMLHPSLGQWRENTYMLGHYGSWSGSYAARCNPFYRSCHEFVSLGHFFAAKVGDPVFAMADGQVVEVGDWKDGWGYYIVYTSTVGGQDITFLSGHLKPKPLPQVGQSVKQGEQIGNVDSIKGKEKEPTRLLVGGHLGPPRLTPTKIGPPPSSARAIHVSRFGLGNTVDLGNRDAYR